MTDATNTPKPSAHINPPPRIRSRQRPNAAEAPSALVAERSDEAPTDYEVGYGKPPVHSRFKAGVSGNRKGRPKKAKGLNTLVREQLLEPLTIRTERGERRIPRVQALLLKMIEKASKGELRALEKLLHLYAVAVPEAAAPNSPSLEPEQLSAADIASISLMRTIFAEEDLDGARAGDDR